jgi:hypothetical protein
MKNAAIIYWVPRILCMLAVLFVSMFALDAFDPKLTVWRQIGGFLIHLIPSFVLVLLLIVAWKWELVGGIIFAALGMAFSPFIFLKNYHMNHSVGWSLLVILTITFPFILTGGLFIYSHFLRKQR